MCHRPQIHNRWRYHLTALCGNSLLYTAYSYLVRNSRFVFWITTRKRSRISCETLREPSTQKIFFEVIRVYFNDFASKFEWRWHFWLKVRGESSPFALKPQRIALPKTDRPTPWLSGRTRITLSYKCSVNRLLSPKVGCNRPLLHDGRCLRSTSSCLGWWRSGDSPWAVLYYIVKALMPRPTRWLRFLKNSLMRAIGRRLFKRHKRGVVGRV